MPGVSGIESRLVPSGPVSPDISACDGVSLDILTAWKQAQKRQAVYGLSFRHSLTPCNFVRRAVRIWCGAHMSWEHVDDLFGSLALRHMGPMLDLRLTSPACSL
jgi:hypothetical protein